MKVTKEVTHHGWKLPRKLHQGWRLPKELHEHGGKLHPMMEHGLTGSYNQSKTNRQSIFRAQQRAVFLLSFNSYFINFAFPIYSLACTSFTFDEL